VKNNNSKPLLRKQTLAARSAISSKQKNLAVNNAAKLFIKNIPMNHNDIIAAYWPISGELDCLPLVEQLWARGHQICLPVTIAENKPLIFRVWQKGQKLIDGGHGIKTPDKNTSILVPNIIIMPLVAFDKKGARLGYGKGYYDRTIAKMEQKPLLVGYGFALQEVEHINSESHDAPLDYVVSEKKVVKF